MQTITLRAPKNTGNRYCGPAAISAITGIGTAEAATVIRSVTGQKAVKGASYHGCTGALKKLGYETRQLTTSNAKGKRPTLVQWLRITKDMRTSGRVFLVAGGNHWFVISGRRYVCGIVKDVVSVRHEGVKRRCRITRAFEVIKTGEPTFIFDAPKKKAIQNKDRQLAKALCKKMGVELEKHWNAVPGQPEYWVCKPEWMTEEEDPADGNHCQIGWDNILELLQLYEKLWLDKQRQPVHNEVAKVSLPRN